MAPPPVKASAASRTLRLFALNLLVLGGGLFLLWLGHRVLHHPQATEPPVATPAGLVGGDAPGPLTSGAYRVSLDGSRWISQASLPPGLQLSFRARPNGLVDYLVLRLTVRDLGERPLPLSYIGASQDVRLLLVSTDPVSFYTTPLTPAEARTISGDAPLANGPVPAGGERQGVVVYAIERTRKGLSLLALATAAPSGAPAAEQPALRMSFVPGR